MPNKRGVAGCKVTGMARGREGRGWRLGEGGGEGASPGTVAKLGV